MWRRPHFPGLLLAACLGCSESNRQQPEAPRAQAIRAAAAAVDVHRLYAHVAVLNGIHSRWMHYDPGTAATINWLLETLAAQGTPASTDSFTFRRIRDIHTANVVLRIPGQVRPGEHVLVGAHWDTTSYPESWQDSTARAPGAVDNASGVAALLELARVLAERPLERTVEIVFVAAEEVGMFGSRRVRDYWRHETGPDSLVCYINVDMLGYDADLPDANILCDTLSAALAADLLPWAQLTGEGLALDTLLRSTGNPGGSSDHLQFWYYGLPAIWVHEGPGDVSPNANTTADSLPDLCPRFLAAGTRALVGAVMHLAEPVLR